MNSKIVCLVFLIFLFFVSCKESTNTIYDCQVEEQPDFINSYFNFQEGTYWIYQEQNSGDLDTLSVFFHSPPLPPSKFDFVWFARCSARNYNFAMRYFEYMHVETNFTLKECYRNYVSSGFERENGNSSVIANFIIGDKLLESSSSVVGVLQFKHDQFLVQGISYSNVLEYYLNQDWNFNQDSTRYFIADHYGIVRWENLVNGEVWELVESNIVK